MKIKTAGRKSMENHVKKFYAMVTMAILGSANFPGQIVSMNSNANSENSAQNNRIALRTNDRAHADWITITDQQSNCSVTPNPLLFAIQYNLEKDWIQELQDLEIPFDVVSPLANAALKDNPEEVRKLLASGEKSDMLFAFLADKKEHIMKAMQNSDEQK